MVHAFHVPAGTRRAVVRLTRSGWSGGLNTATINALAFVGAASFLSGGYDAALTRWQLEPAATRDAPELSALTVEELRGLIRRLAGAHGGLRRRGLSEVRWRPEAAMGAGSLRWCLGCRPAWPQGDAARSLPPPGKAGLSDAGCLEKEELCERAAVARQRLTAAAAAADTSVDWD